MQMSLQNTSKGFSKIHQLISSHTLAYNPNARLAYGKSQHAEDFGHIKTNLYLILALAVRHKRVTETCAGRIKMSKALEYVCVTSQTH